MSARRLDLTDRNYIDAWESARGRITKAATILGVNQNAIRTRMKRMQRTGEYNYEETRAKYQAEDNAQALRGMPLKGTSTLLGPDGEIKLQWVKAERGPIDPDQVAEIVREAFKDCAPVKRIPQPKGAVQKDLLTVIPIGDQHHGMYAWADEAGDNYNTAVSEKLLTTAARHLIEISPVCETCLIVNLGDYFHYDSQRAETPQNKNALDADTRYAKMIRGGVAMMRAFIECALAKYRNVRVINSPGNHDPVGALWLSLALGQFYEKNPRVTIDQSPGKFAYYQHGKVMLCVTHGDTVKPDKLGSVMAADQPAMWGASEHRYGLTGHVHQDRVVETPGVKVESFRTLAARDAWASSQAYRSGRDMKALVYHAEHGEIARSVFNVSMLE